MIEKVYKEELSLDETKKKQKEMLKKIKDLKKRVNTRTGPKPNITNKDKMENVVKNV